MATFVIVDDSKIARSLLRTLLESEGHTVVGEGANGLEGYDLYAEHKPDVITLDVTMPLVNGVGCLKNIIKNFPDARVVMVTSVAKDSLIEETMQIGAKAVMVKPVEKKEALSVIRELLESE